MIDAWGKLPSGLLRGNFKWPGEWNECIQQKANRTTGSGLLEGAWSMVGIQLPSSIMPSAMKAPVSFSPRTGNFACVCVCMCVRYFEHTHPYDSHIRLKLTDLYN